MVLLPADRSAPASSRRQKVLLGPYGPAQQAFRHQWRARQSSSSLPCSSQNRLDSSATCQLPNWRPTEPLPPKLPQLALRLHLVRVTCALSVAYMTAPHLSDTKHAAQEVVLSEYNRKRRLSNLFISRTISGEVLGRVLVPYFVHGPSSP